MNLVSFPAFEPLSLGMRHPMERITAEFEPYSDFGFVSLWAWDVDGEALVADLNGNLVVRFSDYVTGAPFYTFLGARLLPETAETVIRHAVDEGASPELQLVPAVVAAELALANDFIISGDRDNDDYTYRLGDLAGMRGRRFMHKRNRISRLEREFGPLRLGQVDARDPAVRDRLMRAAEDWRANDADDRELRAIERTLSIAGSVDLIVHELRNGEGCLGFTIAEVIHRGYGCCHFLKVRPATSGASDALIHAQAQDLVAAGCSLLNMEQDLGLPGLRFWKEQWCPVAYLHKHSISQWESGCDRLGSD